MKEIKNGKIILPEGIVEKNLYFNEKICEKNIADEVIDAKNLYVSAGFINIHIHGYFGFDIMDNCTEVQKNLPKSGVTSFLPTTMTMPLEKIKKSVKKVN